MAKWKLRLFGEFRLSSDEGEVISALGRRDRAVLAYLALTPGRRESRDRLASLLWSNRGEEQARHSLVQSTAVVRKALGDVDKAVVQSEPASIAVDWSLFDVDVLDFLDLIEDGSLESLQEAVDHYTDDFLPGFELRSEGFDEWILRERDRLRAIAVDAYYRLTSLYAQADDWDAVIDIAGRTLRLDALREDAHRLLMRAYAQTGQRALALQQYKTLVTVLDSEFQVTPDAETETLIDDIKNGRISNGKYGKENGEGHDESAAGPDLPRARGVLHRFRTCLYWAAGAVVVVFLAAVISVTATFWRVPELAPAPLGAYIRDIKTTFQPHPLSIAILTFESHGDGDPAEFAEALSDAITAALSISSEMRVISRSEARHFGDASNSPQEIAEMLRVRYLLEGSVNKWGDQITIETGLVDTQQGQHRIWSESYRRRAEDFFQFQQDVTFDVIKSLEIRLTQGEQERISRMGGTQILHAWLAAARGEKHIRLLTPQDNLVARASYERALQLDPNYVGAMEGLAWTYFVSARFGWTASLEEAVVKARQLGERTLTLAPNRAQAFSLLGSLSLIARDYSKAVELGERAFSLDPNDSDIAALLAYTLTYTGEPERAISLVDRATSRRPVPPLWYDWLRGRAYRLTGRFDQAIEVLSVATRDAPASAIPFIELAAAYAEIGELDLAKSAADAILELSPQFTTGMWVLLSPYEDDEDLRREVNALRAAGLPD
jgi:DNA-binding SARP family transcriptional activator/TolB-like protein